MLAGSSRTPAEGASPLASSPSRGDTPFRSPVQIPPSARTGCGEERAQVGGEGGFLPSLTEALRFELQGIALVA